MKRRTSTKAPKVSWRLWLQKVTPDAKDSEHREEMVFKLLLEFDTAAEAEEAVSKLIDELYAHGANGGK